MTLTRAAGLAEGPLDQVGMPILDQCSGHVDSKRGPAVFFRQAGTILNVWTERPPDAPLRQLVGELRRRGKRALTGTSANLSGQPTITDAEKMIAVFGQRVSTILLQDFAAVPPRRRCSATIVDFTQPQPHLVREGSVPAGEVAAELGRLSLGELVIGAHVRRV